MGSQETRRNGHFVVRFYKFESETLLSSFIAIVLRFLKLNVHNWIRGWNALNGLTVTVILSELKLAAWLRRGKILSKHFLRRLPFLIHVFLLSNFPSTTPRVTRTEQHKGEYRKYGRQHVAQMYIEVLEWRESVRLRSLELVPLLTCPGSLTFTSPNTLQNLLAWAVVRRCIQM